ncbi:MAG: plasmid replication initiator [Proteobacteria bacterium]|nr:plasmid replication initiator [Pseudomonadota bacterium]
MPNLVPHRHHPDLFLADLMTAPLKELAEHLEFPFFGLARQPLHGARRFEDERGNYIELRPGLEGLPTIQDQDILIYCMSVAMAEVRNGRPVPEQVQMTASDLLRFTNRSVGGNQYNAMEKAIYRLTELTLKTNLRGEESTYTRLFGVVDEASMVRRHSLQRRYGGALLGCSIMLSKWILEALEARRVLTLHNDYFRLRTPLERAVYQVVRKHCGEQRMWNIGLVKLQAKVGSRIRLRDFRRQIRTVVGRWVNQDFLDYCLEFDNDADQLVARYAGDPRRIPANRQPAERRLTPRTLETIRRKHPDLDPGQMEQLWRNWAARQPELPRNTQAAFLGFCKRYVELRTDGDFRDRNEPRPALGEVAHPEALRWWQDLPPYRQEAAVQEFQICGHGHDWAFARTEKQIIETAARMWGGIERP